MTKGYNAGDEKDVRKNKTKAKLERERQLEEMKQLLDKPSNRYFLWRMLTYCKVFHSISASDPHMMAVHSGMRDAGLWTLGEIFEASPKAFALMQSEGEERDSKQGVKA